MLNKLNDFFTINGNKRIVIISLVFTFLICCVSYSAFISCNFVSPDGILEGIHYYIDKDWALGGCGRWSLVLINMLHANLVFPWLTVIECSLMNWLSAFIINKLLNITNEWLHYLSCALFVVIPPIILVFTYTFTAVPYCLSILLSILFVYFNSKNNIFCSIFASICLGVAMGMYQAQIGVAAGLTVICVIKNIIEENNNCVKFIILSFVSGAVAILVYVIGLNICLKVFDLSLIARASSFSFSNIISNLSTKLIDSYRVFFRTFSDTKLIRQYVYMLLMIIFIFNVAAIIIKLIKKNKYSQLVIIVVLIGLLPVFINIVGLLLPAYEITELMLVPEYVFLFFCIYLTNLNLCLLKNVLLVIECFCLLLLLWTHVLSANATYDCYKMSYNIYKSQFEESLDEVYELDGFIKNNTRIVVIGRPSDKILRDNIGVYKYAENLYENLLYWNDPHLDPTTTFQYLLNEFGIDSGIIEYEEYIDFVNKEECVEMPSYPKKGYVQMVDGNAVIKFNNIYE